MKMRKEVYVTSDSRLFGVVQDELRKRNIEYKTKIVNSGTGNRMTGTWLGQIGERPQLGMMYYVYAEEDQVQAAKKVIAEVLRE